MLADPSIRHHFLRAVRTSLQAIRSSFRNNRVGRQLHRLRMQRWKTGDQDNAKNPEDRTNQEPTKAASPLVRCYYSGDYATQDPEYQKFHSLPLRQR